MECRGSLHILRLDDPYRPRWRYLLCFAPYEGELNQLPQRTCDSTNELETVLSRLGLDGVERLQLIAEVQRDSARTVQNIHATDDKLRALGF
jgi:hypothetical protein